MQVSRGVPIRKVNSSQHNTQIVNPPLTEERFRANYTVWLVICDNLAGQQRKIKPITAANRGKAVLIYQPPAGGARQKPRHAGAILNL